MSHSPAPWTLHPHVKSYPSAPTHQEIRDAGGHLLFADETYYPECSENDADWPLVAAAPELLAALKSLHDTGLVREMGTLENKAALAAIAKAEGRS